jgi:23S rRNA (cytidine1920-2'-O)/16S rRNA (cytidine1409-2'-O)-methyltransferase
MFDIRESRIPNYNTRMPKLRLDLLLVERGLAESRAKAQALIMAGRVRVDDQVVLKPGTAVQPAARLDLERGPRFVSRGGEKLEAALSDFGLEVSGLVCADVGASTGGFTDCLLQHAAARVYAIDVGKGLLDWKLRNDPRVVVMEGLNARHLESLPEQVSLVTIDASFISLRMLLPVVRRWLIPSSPAHPVEQSGIIALIKPQFEAGKKEARHGGGVIREPEIHRRVLLEVLAFAQEQGLGLRGLIRSPLLGPKGNAEFLACLDGSGSGAGGPIAEWIERAVAP